LTRSISGISRSASRTMSVSRNRKYATPTWTPSGIISVRMQSLSASTPALAAQYALIPGARMTAAVEAMLSK